MCSTTMRGHYQHLSHTSSSLVLLLLLTVVVVSASSSSSSWVRNVKRQQSLFNDFRGNNDPSGGAGLDLGGQEEGDGEGMEGQQERNRIKEALAKEVADYLYSFLKAASAAGQSTPLTSGSPGGPIPMPGQAFDYSEYMDQAQLLQQQQQQQQQMHPDASRLYMKKSMQGEGGGGGAGGGGGGGSNRHIRFHQCYFNPISCFK